MRQRNFLPALLLAALLAACGGSGSGSSGSSNSGSSNSSASSDSNQTPKVRFSAEVIFGDSLADVGTYAVGAVAAAGGGKYTINSDNTAVNPALTGKIWVELIAAQLRLPAPCAAQTGLDGDAALGISVPVANHSGCYGYAQGGARVTNPVGPGNKRTGSPFALLTVPVVTQVANHLSIAGGKFKGDEVVFVMAGGNDAFALLDQLAAGAAVAGGAAAAAQFAITLIDSLAATAPDPVGAAAATATAVQSESSRTGHTDASLLQAAVAAAAAQPGNAAVADPAVYGPILANALADAAVAGGVAAVAYAAENGPAAVNGMATAGAQLAVIVKDQLIAKGANFVVVNNLPDVAISPGALAQPQSTRTLIREMVAAFNEQLKAGVEAESKVQYVDLYTLTHDQAVNPAPYGLSNTTAPACGPNLLGGSSLVCNINNLVPGDVSHYMFADDAHPTPFEHSLVARTISQQMIAKGWM
jgi:outer membrane lipase/esterase